MDRHVAPLYTPMDRHVYYLHQFLFGNIHYLQGHLKYINPEALLKKEHMVLSTAIDDLFFTKNENKV